MVAFTDAALNGSPLWNLTPCRSVNSHVVSLTTFHPVASMGDGLYVLASRSTSRSYMCSTWSLVVQSTIVFGRTDRGSAAKATMTSFVFERSCAQAAGSPRPE